MITFYTEVGNQIQIPTSFYDITLEKFLRMTKDGVSDIEVLEIVTGLPLAKLVLIDTEPILEALDFMRSESMHESIEPSNVISVNGKDFLLKENEIMRESWGRKIYATNLLKEGKVLEIFFLYFYPKFQGLKKCKPIKEKHLEKMKSELLQISVHEVFACANFITKQLQSVLEADARMLSVKPTAEQIEAKIDMFDVLGDFNTIDLFAGGNPLLYSKIERLPYEIIFPKLLKNTISTKFERNLRSVKSK